MGTDFNILTRADQGESDQELVAEVMAGREEAFEQLFERHKLHVARLAGRFFRNREQVEDMVQSCFTEAYFGLSRFQNLRAASFEAWLTRIAVTTCLDELRRMRRRPEDSLDDLGPEDRMLLESGAQGRSRGASPEDAVVSRDLAARLLSSLHPKDRVALTLLEAGGHSIAEIAKMTGWSKANVKVRIFRARLKLRRLLDKLAGPRHAGRRTVSGEQR